MKIIEHLKRIIFKRYYDLEEQIKQTNIRLSELVTENSKLASLIERLNNDYVSYNNAINKMNRLEAIIKERTDISISTDISHRRSRNTVIVTGFYKTRDYVEIFSIENEEFDRMVEHLKYLKKTGYVKVIDAPISYKHVIEDYLGID